MRCKILASSCPKPQLPSTEGPCSKAVGKHSTGTIRCVGDAWSQQKHLQGKRAKKPHEVLCHPWWQGIRKQAQASPSSFFVSPTHCRHLRRVIS